MRILITGGAGMLGRDLARRFAAAHEIRAIDRAECDIAAPARVDEAVRAWKPQVVIHCAAMTQVDLCESKRDDAYRANALGSANVAIACARHGARLVAISTDYVFPGDADRPYHEHDLPAPRTAYGESKWAGEQAVRAHCPDHLIARIAWLYGPGGPSFVHTMMKLAAQDGPALKVVDDQVGNPTSTAAVAVGLARLIDIGACGTVHLTCEGETSWCGFAHAIFAARSSRRGIAACTTAEYPRPAPRPRNSRLEKMGLRLLGLPPMPTWEEALSAFFAEHADG
jgi:dTDP-4-dehydrorhamnose reductase